MQLLSTSKIAPHLLHRTLMISPQSQPESPCPGKTAWVPRFSYFSLRAEIHPSRWSETEDSKALERDSEASITDAHKRKVGIRDLKGLCVHPIALMPSFLVPQPSESRWKFLFINAFLSPSSHIFIPIYNNMHTPKNPRVTRGNHRAPTQSYRAFSAGRGTES
jgi:hypothetical protein